MCVSAPGLRTPRAQQTANPPEVRSNEVPPPFRIQVERNLVTVRVVVRDPEGRTVGNLTQIDFRVLDNGKPQEISGFAVESTTGNAAAPAAAPAAAQPGPAATAVAHAAAPPQRFVGLFFDDLHLPTEAVQRARNAAWRYVTTEVGTADRVALFTASHQDDLDFTSDRDQLHDALFRVAPRSRTLPQINDCPSIDEYQAYLIDQRRDRQATGIAVGDGLYCDCVSKDNNTPACTIEVQDRVRYESAQIWQMADLQAQDSLERIAAAINRLAAMAGQRTLVLVSPGFLTETRSDDIEALIRGALRDDVVISAIDAVGLVPWMPRQAEDLSHPELAAQKDVMYQMGENISRDVLANLSSGTGGVFFHNSNDLNAGFHETAAAPEVAYVLSFSPADFKLDGKFHTLKVSLNTKKPWSIEARRGYFDPTQALAQQAPGQDQLDKLMFSQDEIRVLPAEVSAETGKLVQPPSTLTVVIHVDVRDLQFRQEAGRSVNTLTFDTALFDRDGKYVRGKEESFDLHLKDETLQKFAGTGIYLKTSFQVEPGNYRIREVVRDIVAKQMSALNCEAQVPGAKPSAANSGKPATN
ncbi:MAG TPA: VWA domain-containing protein [Terriglobia bacterium]|nr:VWA domain-containing protein [Terriglobia bacterium]